MSGHEEDEKAGQKNAPAIGFDESQPLEKVNRQQKDRAVRDFTARRSYEKTKGSYPLDFIFSADGAFRVYTGRGIGPHSKSDFMYL